MNNQSQAKSSIAFTICSNNYLAKARVVSETFLSHNPGYEFIIFLVDVFHPNVAYNNIDCRIIEIRSILPYVNELATRYNIVELNTAVKPAVFLHLFKEYNTDCIVYLDPDLMIFDRFNEIEDLLITEANNIVITPHGCSPIDDGKVPSEINISVFGIYNLGFIAVKSSEESMRFLKWWHERLMKYCFIKPDEGMFTDQLWINYAPAYFDKVHILKHLGYNVANWNLYERRLTLQNGTFYVNNTYKLKFFHFSHYSFSNPYLISTQQNRHTIEEREDLKVIIDDYQSKLIENFHETLSQIPCHYQQLYLSTQNELKRKADREYYTLKRKLKIKGATLFRSIFGV